MCFKEAYDHLSEIELSNDYTFSWTALCSNESKKSQALLRGDWLVDVGLSELYRLIGIVTHQLMDWKSCAEYLVKISIIDKKYRFSIKLESIKSRIISASAVPGSHLGSALMVYKDLELIKVVCVSNGLFWIEKYLSK